MTATPLWQFDTFTDARWNDDGDARSTVLLATDHGSQAAWPKTQPGMHDATGGFRSHRIQVEFTVATPTAARLRLEFFADRGPCPDLLLSLDGHVGLFHPVVLRDDRSLTGEPGPVAGFVQLEVDFPKEWLAAGEHSLVIATVFDEAAALGNIVTRASHAIATSIDEELPPARSNYGAWFGSYLRWSHASLIPGEVSSPEPTVQVTPTPFFVQTGEGERELIDVDLTWVAGQPQPEAPSLIWDDQTIRLDDFPAGRDFGMFRQRISAPSAFTAPLEVTVALPGTTSMAVLLKPARRWTLHLIPHVHLDLGFTDTQGKVLELHTRNIDRALDLMDADSAFRYSVDGSIVAREFEKTRSRRQVQRMRAAIERGALGVNALTANLLTGITSLDELNRACSYSLTLPMSTKTGIRYANLTDVPTATRALPSILAAAGIDGFIGMSNHHRAATDSSDVLHLMSPVRWQGPDEKEVLAFFADHYSQLRFIAADPQSVAAATNGLARFLDRYERDDYLPADLPLIGTHADNEDLGDGDIGFVERWNERFTSPRIRVSTFDEYLAAVRPLTEKLPVWSKDSGSFWEDQLGSAVMEFAQHREAQVALPAVETVGAALSLADDSYRVNRGEIDRAWHDLAVGAEHTLTWARATTHPHAFPVDDQFGWKTHRIRSANRTARDERTRQLGRLAETADAQGPGFMAVNPHPWQLDLEGELDVAAGVELLDETGAPLPMEALSDCAGMRRYRVAIPAMPPHSYRYFPVSSDPLTVPAGEEGAADGTERTPLEVASKDDRNELLADGFERPDGLAGSEFEIAGWRVRLDPETDLPRSLVRIDSGDEYLDPDARETLGQLVRTLSVSAPDSAQPEVRAPGAFHQHTREKVAQFDTRYAAERTEIARTSPRTGFDGARTTFDGSRLRWSGSGAGVESVTIDLLLRSNSTTVDLEIRFDKQPTLDMEALYVAFPFAGRQPRIHVDRQLGWTEPAVTNGPGASNEWGAVNSAVVVENPGLAIIWTPLDTPLYTSQDVVRGNLIDRYESGTGHLFSYAMNNYWPCNTPPLQSGPTVLRYSFTGHAVFDPAEAQIAGISARSGMQIELITALDRINSGRAPQYRAGRLLALGLDRQSNATLFQLDEDSFELRLTNLTATAREVTATLPAGLQVAGDAPADSAAASGVTVALGPDGTAVIELTPTRTTRKAADAHDNS